MNPPQPAEPIERASGGRVPHNPPLSPPSDLQNVLAKVTEAVSNLAEAQKAPRRIIRDENNRPVGIEIDHSKKETE